MDYDASFVGTMTVTSILGPNCFNITVIDDGIFECREQFDIVVEVVEIVIGVNVLSCSTTIFIVDQAVEGEI